ncbi:MAG: murein transglycosylase [Herbaspirillum sp.]|jgi:membrane-bound lytic murein transglycosylase A|nr:murein transglycosylase [Herbaspirillum sp.]
MSFTRLSLPAIAIFTALILAGCGTAPPGGGARAPIAAGQAPGSLPPQPVGEHFQRAGFADLPGWGHDDLRQAWPAFIASCSVLIRRADWLAPCTDARNVDAGNESAIRNFFESRFVPYRVLNPDGTDNGLITGYYEPLLQGARKRGGRYQTPLYRAPSDLLTVDLGSVYPELKNMRLRGRLVGGKVVPYYSRAELDQPAALAGNELLWVNDAIDAFFLQVQGSGRVHLNDSNETVRIVYADQNGYPYKSIGRYLVDKGELRLDQASAQGIKTWLAANPGRQQELLNINPSYVFFREEKLVDPSVGPKGALGVPLTAQRSIAVDPQAIPLGAPVFLATTQPNSDANLQRLVMAQDSGGAIKGAVRADYFWGFGDGAGELAGRMKQRLQMWLLLPSAASSMR